ncbi:uroporphyrinogen-III synthase [Pseudoroseicyclus aestuarii]|uniref:Uroporphyrinogen-III synthase n=1 Tax=Pseudoroseicyclus aestuarii TaxID=1795041 RepID=A0A318SS20_9RHOB|nr:uroporphyrinogen-III synthase [Pseudoroseicyclus aestuarii]PYE84620.1 uroporphyrinogen-III synthase [Pseudoroseicyclus aestuarii]
MPHSLPQTLPHLLLTRPAGGADRLHAALEAAAGQPWPATIAPILRIAPLPLPPMRPEGLILTSLHGAEAAALLSLPPGTPTWCVGARTAQAAAGIGLAVRLVAEDAEALVLALRSDPPPHPLLHLRGRVARGDIAARLRAAGLQLRDQVAYDQLAQPLAPEGRALLAGTAPVIAPLASPRSAALLAPELRAARAPWRAAALSAAVAQALGPLPEGCVTVAGAKDLQGLVAATLRAAAAFAP